MSIHIAILPAIRRVEKPGPILLAFPLHIALNGVKPAAVISIYNLVGDYLRYDRINFVA